MELRFRAGDLPDGTFTEIGRWQLRHLADLRSLRLALRSSVPGAEQEDLVGRDDGQVQATLETVPERLLLVANELASNALKHSDGGAVVVLARGEDGWLVDVIDAAVDVQPTPAMDRSPGDGGYGLYLAAELTSAIGWYEDGRSKHVWGQITPVDRSA